jgi:hypothetical protein
VELLRGPEAQITAGVTDAEAIYTLAEAYSARGDKSSALVVAAWKTEFSAYCTRDPLRSEPEVSELLHNARHRHEEFQRKFA